jgi:hypothetical protein
VLSQLIFEQIGNVRTHLEAAMGHANDYGSIGETDTRGFENAGQEMEDANRKRAGSNPEKRSLDFTNLPDAERHQDAGDKIGMIPSEQGGSTTAKT